MQDTQCIKRGGCGCVCVCVCVCVWGGGGVGGEGMAVERCYVSPQSPNLNPAQTIL